MTIFDAFITNGGSHGQFSRDPNPLLLQERCLWAAAGWHIWRSEMVKHATPTVKLRLPRYRETSDIGSTENKGARPYYCVFFLLKQPEQLKHCS